MCISYSSERKKSEKGRDKEDGGEKYEYLD